MNNNWKDKSLCIMFIGLLAANKTNFYFELIERVRKVKFVHVSTLHSLGDFATKNSFNYNNVFKDLKLKFDALLPSRLSSLSYARRHIVIDHCNIDKKSREYKLSNLFNRDKYHVVGVTFDKPLAHIEIDIKNKHYYNAKIPEVLKSLVERYSSPFADEGFDNIIPHDKFIEDYFSSLINGNINYASITPRELPRAFATTPARRTPTARAFVNTAIPLEDFGNIVPPRYLQELNTPF